MEFSQSSADMIVCLFVRPYAMRTQQQQALLFWSSPAEKCNYPSTPCLVSLAFSQHITILLQRTSDELGLLPQVGGQESVGVADGHEGRLEGVLEGLGASRRRGVGVLHTGQLQQSLDGGRGDEAGSSGRGDQTDGDGAAFAGLLGGQRVRLTEVGAPVASSDGEDGEFGDDDGGADGGRDFLRGLDAETDVALAVANDHDGLESGTLTGAGLLLDGFDLEEGETLEHDNSKAGEISTAEDVFSFFGPGFWDRVLISPSSLHP